MDAIFDSVPEHLKCPICFEMPEGKVFQCKDGHVICEACVVQLKECPQCRVKFTKDGIRNRLHETLLDDIKIKCPYADSGCREQINRKTMKSHIENCCNNIAKYGFFINVCQLFGDETCAFELNHGNTAEAIRHFAEEHNISVVEGISTCSKLAMKNLDRSLFKDSDMYYYGTEIFDRCNAGYAILMLAIFNKTEKSASMIPLHMPYNKTPLELQVDAGLQVEMSFMSNQNEDLSDLIPLKWSVFPIDILKVDKILPNQYPFRFPLSLLEQYCGEDGSISIQCTIRNEYNYLELQDSANPVYQSLLSVATGMDKLKVADAPDALASAPMYEAAPPPLPPPIRPRLDRQSGSSRVAGVSHSQLRPLPRLPSTKLSSEEDSSPATGPCPVLGATSPTSSALQGRRKPVLIRNLVPEENCRKCSGKLEKIIFRCLQCKDFTICKRCMKKGEHNHLFAIVINTSQFDKLKRKTTETNRAILALPTEVDKWWDSYTLMHRVSIEDKLKELDEKCIFCQDKRIAFVCLECPCNTSICKSCLKKGHHPHHVMAETGLFDRKSDVRRKFLLYFQIERNMKGFL